MKKIISLILIIALSFSLIGCSFLMSQEQKIDKLVELLTAEKWEEARKFVKKNFKKEEHEDWLHEIYIYESFVYGDKNLQILNPKVDTSLSGYTRWAQIHGSIKNTGNQTVKYFEVWIDFTDKAGNVIHSDWTNSATELRPGNSQMFSLMFEIPRGFDNFTLRVADTRLK